MASRISQMRNGTWQQPPQQQQQPQDQYNQSIEQVRNMMRMVQGAQNPQAMLAQILQSNPNTAAISNMLKGGGSLESIARQMAQTQGRTVEQVIQDLMRS